MDTKRLHVLLLIVLLTPCWAWAGLTDGGPDHRHGLYHHAETDLSLPYFGAQIRVTRQWNADHWDFNRNWDDLILEGPADEPERILRAGEYVYERRGFASDNRPLYRAVDSPGKKLYATDSGWRWEDLQGQWIDYDPQGRLLRFGDRNDNRLRAERNEQGRIGSLHDASDQIWLSLAYDTGGHLIEATDRHGRSVAYHWQGADLTGVTDARGQDWAYGYVTLLEKRYLASLTNPLGESLSLDYVELPGGLQTICGTGEPSGHWIVEEVEDPETGELVQRERYVLDEVEGRSDCITYTAPPSVQMIKMRWSDGPYRSLRYYYQDTERRYILIERSSDGAERERWYDLRGRVVRDVRAGQTVSQQRIASDAMRSTDAAGRVTLTERDAYERPIEVRHPDGAIERWRWHPRFELPTRYTDPLGVVETREYDEHGNLITLTEALGTAEQRTTSYTYDEHGRLLTETRPGDALWTHRYNALGQRIETTDPEGGITRYADFDPLDQPRQLTDANGNIWRYSYDALGKLLTETDPLDHVTDHTYDAAGRRMRSTFPGDREDLYVYDPRDRLIRHTEAAGSINATTTYARRLDGKIQQIADPQGRLVRIDYDPQGRPVRLEVPGAEPTQFVYAGADDTNPGAFSQPVRIVRAGRVETLRYDPRGRLLQRDTDHDGRTDTQTEAYDLAGNRIARTDANGHTRRSRYDPLGRLVESEGADGGITVYGYDGRDNLTQVTDPEGAITRYAYDLTDRRSAETRPDAATIQYRYDPAGNRIETIHPSGRRNETEHDPLDRPIAERFFMAGEDTPAIVETLSYDEAGDLREIHGPTATLRYSRDALGRALRTETDYGGFTLVEQRSYDRSGRTQTYTDPAGKTRHYDYDPAGRWQATVLDANRRIEVTQRDADGRPTTITFPSATETRNYDGLGQLLEKVLTGGTEQAPTLPWQAAYAYDPVGNRIRTDSSTTHDYQYDAEDRLTDVLGTNPETFAYDRVGNRTVHTRDTQAQGPFQYGPDHRLLQTADSRYHYDADGNLIEKIEHPDTPEETHTTYGYDAKGRLQSVHEGDTLIATYRYDPLGRRIKKQVGDTTTYFHYTDEGLAGEYDAAGAPIRRYGYLPDSGYATAPQWLERDGEVYYFQTDPLGTPQSLVDGQGTVAWAGEYEAFGRVVASVGTVEQPLRLPGQYFDGETGWHYNIYRYYDSGAGRYTRRDPLGLYPSLNVYAYVDGRPYYYYDPYGLMGMDWLWKPIYEHTHFEFDQETVDFAAGFGDTLSFGGSSWLREQFGIDGGVNQCSKAYNLGEWTGLGLSAAFSGVHLGRNALYQTGRAGGLGKGIRRLFVDNRSWNTIRDMWSLSAGNGTRWLKINNQSLHHWLIPQRFGLVHAGFNYMPISARFNSWMNGTTAFRTAVEWGFRVSVAGIYSAPVTAGLNSGNECECAR